MKDIVTKENWSSDPNNAPLPSDFNRIESNIRKVEENRQEETTARQTADTTLQNNIDLKAPLASPALTGNPTAPTQSPSDNSTKIATTAYADAAVGVEASARAAISTALNDIDSTGTIAFLYSDIAFNPGDIIASSHLYYGCAARDAAGAVGSPRPSGNWKCIGGALNAFSASVFIKQ